MIEKYDIQLQNILWVFYNAPEWLKGYVEKEKEDKENEVSEFLSDL